MPWWEQAILWVLFGPLALMLAVCILLGALVLLWGIPAAFFAGLFSEDDR